MHHEIGQAAGLVLDLLTRHGECSALKIRSDLRMTQTALYLAFGWLSREGKVDIVARDRTYWVVAKP
ncbi:MAG TPA: winged helix-turn-helix domain-containing protein [Elusimicrobiota bacterium]|nr:winged helix-turn-helix domain-containing protein [Elusimicrobiota bacterium]